MTTTANSGAMSVSWAPNPTYDDVIDYRVRVASTAWASWADTLPDAFVATAGCCSFHVDSLQNERTYWAGVSARNVVGEGPISHVVHARPPGWGGNQAYGGPSVYLQPRALAVGSNGELFFTGIFSGPMAGATGSGAFLSHVFANGHFDWLKAVTMNNFLIAYAMKASHVDGTFILAGASGVIGGGTNDYAVAKMNPDGSTAWSHLFGTALDDDATGVAVDPSGNIYVAGYTYGALGGQTNNGSTDAFLAKFSSGGSLLWTRLVGTAAEEEGVVVVCDTSGFAYLIGNTAGSLDGVTNAGGNDVFVTKFDANGNKVWSPGSRLIGTAASDFPQSADMDLAGNIVFAGVSAPSGGPGNGNSIYAGAISSSGVVQWSKSFATLPARALGISKRQGGVVIAATTGGDLGGGGSDPIAIALDGSGNLAWQTLFASPSKDYASAIAVDSNGEIFMMGVSGDGLPVEGALLFKIDPSGAVVPGP